MKIFVYEWVSATADVEERSSTSASLRAEGEAMLNAVLSDFSMMTEVRTLTHATPNDEFHQLRALAAWADDSLIIAPEFDDILATRVEWVLSAGGQLLGSSPEAIRLTGDKLALADHWQQLGVPTPHTVDAEKASALPYPQVWKPRDGAGSQAMSWVDHQGDVIPIGQIAQEYVPGRAASVALLVGKDRTIALPPCWQHLSKDGRFTYLGGECPIPKPFADRAEAIARKAIADVPGLCGYVGVDVILGDSRDVAIEINPRLTTSYIGLRQLARFNLATAMLACVGLAPWPVMTWHNEVIRFAPL